MTTILYRINPAQNMRRFYRLDVQRDLFGQWCVVREWGRVGRAGRIAIASYGSREEADTNLGKVQNVKAKRGYTVAQ